MKTVGRFITRGSGDGTGPVDLILGAGFKGNSFEPNAVYEIFEFDGALTIRKVGPVEVGPVDHNTNRMWGKSVNRVLEENFPLILVTAAERQLTPP